MKRKVIGCISVFILLLAVLIAVFLWNGVILFNHPSEKGFPVRGVDVSHYQGDIDWTILARQNIDFAFIKATEGSSYVDPMYSENAANSQKTGLRVGAYHFFSFDSAAASQAENFIQTVESFPNMLPPVIDFEFYGDKEKNPPERASVIQSLNEMLNLLEAHYGVKPILYATEKSYDRYLSGQFEGYDIWIRNVLSDPVLSDDRDFTFWQYTNRERLPGYKGKERFIDMNVFNGTESEFAQYGQPQ